MKKLFLMALILSLTACAGGSGGSSGNTGNTTPNTPGQSAYELWLAQGHTGTEQDFLDWLLSGGNNGSNEVVTRNFNKQVELDEYVEFGDPQGGHDYHYTQTDKPWAKYGGFKQYNANYLTNVPGTYVVVTYNEKELDLSNYGVAFYKTWTSSGGWANYSANGYVTNRDIDYGSNAYIPETGTVFTGGTLAYIYKNFKYDPDESDKILIKGDATFTYNPTNPSLVLDFDNYYTFAMNFPNSASGGAAYGLTSSPNGTSVANVTVSGTNNTGNSDYNLTPGAYSNTNAYLRTQHFQQNNTEEATGMYYINSYSVGGTNNCTMGSDCFQITGGFGGTKQ